MPINVGTVEAVLAARDEISPVLVRCAEQVVQLRNQLGNLGVSSVTEFNKLYAELKRLEATFEALTGTTTTATSAMTAEAAAAVVAASANAQAATGATQAAAAMGAIGVSGAAAAGGLKAVEAEAGPAGQSLSQVEGIAQRLIERMIILFAIKGTFDFVKGVFDAATALVALNEQSGLSLTVLQQLQFTANQTDIPFEKVASAVDNLDKKLASAKATTSESLGDIGLSFDKVFSAGSADERFNLVVASIAGIGDQMKRTKAEVELFGTDAIDPLIVKFKDLSKSATVQPDETITALATVEKQYKAMWDSFAEGAATAIVKTQDLIALLASPFFGGNNGTDAVLGMLTNEPAKVMAYLLPDWVKESLANIFGKSAEVAPNLPPLSPSLWIGPNRPGDITSPGPVSGWDRIHQLESKAPPLTGDQRAQLDDLKKLNELTADNAVLMRDSATGVYVTAEQYKAYTKSLVDAKGALKELHQEQSAEADLRKLQDAAATAHQLVSDTGIDARLDKLEGQKQAALDSWQKKFDMNKGETEATYIQGLTAIENTYYDKSTTELNKYYAKQEEIHAQAQDDIDKIIATGNEARDATLGTAMDRQLAQVERWVASEKAIWDKKLDSGKVDMVDWWTAITAIDQAGQLKEEEILKNRLKAIEGSGPAISNLNGPIPDSPLYKPYITQTWSDEEKALGQLGRAFNDLATVAGGALGSIVRDFGQVIIATELTMKGLDTYVKAKAPGKEHSVAGEVEGLISAGAGFLASTGTGNIFSDTLGGTLSGMEIGKMFGPEGAVPGAIIGGAIGFMRDIFGLFNKDHTPDDIARDAGYRFGQHWSEALQKQIVQAAHEFNDEVTGEIASLPAIIAEHPVSTENVDLYLRKAHDIFSAIQVGHMSVEQGTKELNQIFPDLATNATDSYGRISDGLRQLIELNSEYGTQVKAIADWQKAQVADTVSGFNAITAAFTLNNSDSIEKLTEDLESVNAQIADLEAKKAKSGLTNVQAVKLTELKEKRQDDQTQLNLMVNPTPQDLKDLGTMAVGEVAQQMATGTSRADAVKAESAALTNLEREYKQLGIAITDSGLRSLFMMNDLQKTAPALMAGIEGLSKDMVGEINLNLETADSFKAQEELGINMYTRLQAQVHALGGDTADALGPMQDFLHQAADEAAKLGIPLDANLQTMIYQSKELGIWDVNAGKVKSTTEKLADAVERLVNWLEHIPSNVNTNVNTNYTSSGSSAPPGGSGGGGGSSEGSGSSGGGSTGGSGTGSGPGAGTGGSTGGPDIGDPAGHALGGVVQYREGGGRILPFVPHPGSTDTAVVAMTPGEGVVTVAGMGRIGVGGLTAINQGVSATPISNPSGGSGGTVHIVDHHHIYVGNTEIAEIVVDRIIEGGTLYRKTRQVVRQMAGVAHTAA